MTPITDLERTIQAHKDAADAKGRREERELAVLLRERARYDVGTRTTNILLAPEEFGRAVRLSRIVDRARGLGRNATLLRMAEKITGRRIE